MDQPLCEHPNCSLPAEWTAESEGSDMRPNLCNKHWEALKETVPAWAARYRRLDREEESSAA